MGDKLTKQDKGFVEAVVKTGNVTQAVKDNYAIKDDNYAGVKGNRLIRKDKIKKAIQSIAEKIPDNELLEVHLEGLKATTKKPHLIDRDDKGRPVYDYVEEDDYSVRHKYLDTAYKLKKLYEVDAINNTNIQVNILNYANRAST